MSLPNSHIHRKLYDKIVLPYIEAQQKIPSHMRPDYRIPSIRASQMERMMKANNLKDSVDVLKEGLL